ncbi:MAG: Ig-like domain-containing protein [bacterium]|nr:Ig-like domain-containing protein [bacterium]
MNIKNIRNLFTTVALASSFVAGFVGIAGAQVASPVITEVATGCQHSLALTSGGTVFGWGRNDYGQVGDNTIVNRSTPTPISGLNGVIGIGAGCYHSVAVKSDGTVWEWGSMNGKRIPTQIPGITGVTAVAGGGGGGTAGGGYDYSIALKNDGTVWAWGSNIYGKLGDGTTLNRETPGQVLNLTGITKISAVALAEHSLALKNDGTVWAWGRNNRGEIGNGTGGTGQFQATPVQVSNITGVVDISSGFAHSSAVTGDGLVWQWGWNRRGEYGNGTGSDSNIPLQTPPGFNTGSRIAGGVAHTLILENDSDVWGSGENVSGQLGNGTFVNTLTPVQTVISGVAAIATGGNQFCGAACSWFGHSLAIKSDTTVWGWGYNANGQVGDGTLTNRNVPVQIFFVPLVDVTPPTAPTNVAASALSSAQINVTWGPSTDNVGVAQYLLYRCAGASCAPVTQIAAPTGTSYFDVGLTGSTVYGYKVVAVDASGNHSADSAVVYATTFAPPDLTAPTVTSAASPASGTTADSFTFSATATDNVGVHMITIFVDGIAVQQCLAASCVYSTTFGAGTHTYYVEATDAAGNIGRDPMTGTGNVNVFAPGEDDGDGILEGDDECSGTVEDAIAPEEGRFMWSGGTHFKTKDPKSKQVVDSAYTMTDTRGCSATQILSRKPGNNSGELRNGATKGTMDNFIRQRRPSATRTGGIPIAYAASESDGWFGTSLWSTIKEFFGIAGE